VGDGSPGSSEAEGDGGKGFYIAQSGKFPDLLVMWGGVRVKLKGEKAVQRNRRRGDI
jgi:hypothetical protein